MPWSATPDAAARYAAVVEAADELVIALDFDGTLAHIVDDPAEAHIHPDAPRALLDLARRVRGVAVVTGRPVEQVLALGELRPVATQLASEGRDLLVFGQYGHERWSARHPVIEASRPPSGLASFSRELTALLRASEWDPWVEEKGLALAVHTRRLADPAAAFDDLRGPITALAEQFDLKVEPGRFVIEARAPGADKGTAVRALNDKLHPAALVFAGDDLGDAEAFAALRALRDEGVSTLCVCSDSPESTGLADIADVVVAGPDGVVAFLRNLAAEIARRAA